jgi:hypothetical protein
MLKVEVVVTFEGGLRSVTLCKAYTIIGPETMAEKRKSLRS